MPAERREEWLSAKVALESYKRQHRRQAVAGCQCPFCITPEQFKARVLEIQERQRQQLGEPPF